MAEVEEKEEGTQPAEAINDGEICSRWSASSSDGDEELGDVEHDTEDDKVGVHIEDEDVDADALADTPTGTERQLSWGELKNIDFGNPFDEDADEHFSAALRSFAAGEDVPPGPAREENVQCRPSTPGPYHYRHNNEDDDDDDVRSQSSWIDTEERAGYPYAYRPISPIAHIPGGYADELTRTSGRWLRRRHPSESDRQRSSRRSSPSLWRNRNEDGKLPPQEESGLRHAESVDDVPDPTPEEGVDDLLDPTPEESVVPEPNELAPEPRKESKQVPQERPVLHVSMSPNAGASSLGRERPWTSGSLPHENPDEPGSPDSATALWEATGIPEWEGQHYVDMVYHNITTARHADRKYHWKLQKRVLQAAQRGMKYSVLDGRAQWEILKSDNPDLVDAFKKAVAHMYRLQRNEYKWKVSQLEDRMAWLGKHLEEKNWLLEEKKRLLEENGYEIGMLKHAVEKRDKLLAEETKQNKLNAALAKKWEEGHKLLRPMAMAEQARLEQQAEGEEDRVSIGIQTDESELDPARQASQGKPVMMRPTGTQTEKQSHLSAGIIHYTPRAEPRWSTIPSRWRQREIEIRETAEWRESVRQCRKVILAKLDRQEDEAEGIQKRPEAFARPRW